MIGVYPASGGDHLSLKISNCQLPISKLCFRLAFRLSGLKGTWKLAVGSWPLNIQFSKGAEAKGI